MTSDFEHLIISNHYYAFLTLQSSYSNSTSMSSTDEFNL